MNNLIVSIVLATLGVSVSQPSTASFRPVPLSSADGKRLFRLSLTNRGVNIIRSVDSVEERGVMFVSREEEAGMKALTAAINGIGAGYRIKYDTINQKLGMQESKKYLQDIAGVRQDLTVDDVTNHPKVVLVLQSKDTSKDMTDGPTDRHDDKTKNTNNQYTNNNQERTNTNQENTQTMSTKSLPMVEPFSTITSPLGNIQKASEVLGFGSSRYSLFKDVKAFRDFVMGYMNRPASALIVCYQQSVLSMTPPAKGLTCGTIAAYNEEQDLILLTSIGEPIWLTSLALYRASNKEGGGILHMHELLFKK